MPGPYTIEEATAGGGDPVAAFNAARAAIFDLDNTLGGINAIGADVVSIYAPVGQYQPAFNFTSTITTGSLATGACNALPFLPGGTFTADQIGMEVSTAGAAGSLLRMALYAPNAAGDRPGALITDYGSMAADSTGYKLFTIDQQFKRRNLFFLAWQTEVAAPTVRARSNTSVIRYPDTQARVFDGFTSSGYVFRMNATGAFPSTWTDNGVVQVTVPVIGFRRSA